MRDRRGRRPLRELVTGALRVVDRKTVSLIGGRYLDRLGKRDGVWRIALRRCTIEWAMNGDTSHIASGAFAGFIDTERVERW